MQPPESHEQASASAYEEEAKGLLRCESHAERIYKVACKWHDTLREVMIRNTFMPCRVCVETWSSALVVRTEHAQAVMGR